MTTGNMKLAFVIEAIDNATAKMRVVNAAVDKATEPIRRLQKSTRELFREAGWDKMQRQMATLRERGAAIGASVRNWALAFAAVTAAGGVAFAGMRRVIDRVDTLNDSAERIGVPVEKLQLMGYAAKLNGSSVDELSQALEKLALSQASAVAGDKEMVQWFERVGLSQQKLRNMRVDEVWERIGDKFAEVGDAGINVQRKLDLLNAVTGRSSRGLVQLANLGSAGMRRVYQEAQRLGVVLDGETVRAMAETNDGFDRLGFVTQALGARITAYALPQLDALTARMRELSTSKSSEWGERIGRAVARITQHLPSLIEGLIQAVEWLGDLIEVVDRVAQAMGGWRVVLTAIAGLFALKLVTGVMLFATTLAQLIPTVLAVGQVVALIFGGLASFFAAPALAIAATVAVVAAALKVLYDKWEPISKFFSKLWNFEGVAGPSMTAPGAALAPAGAPLPQLAAQGGSSKTDVAVKLELADGLRAKEIRQSGDNAATVDAYSGVPLSGF